jgi:hypothetical protein
MSSTASYPTQLAQLDDYISTYWQILDSLFPIIHHGTFDSTVDSLLSSAMAAMGSQYHDTPEARQRGIELNEYCRKSIGLVNSQVVHPEATTDLYIVSQLESTYHAGDSAH